MSGTEYAVANAAAFAELRSFVDSAGACLVWLFVACLGGWLILGCIAATKYLSWKRLGLPFAILAVLLMSQMALAQPFCRVSSSQAHLWSVGATVTPMVVGGGLLYASFGEGSDNFVIWGLAVGSAGLVFGPGAGYAYARKWGQALQGTAIRVAGGGLFLCGVLTLNPFDDSGSSGAELLLISGSLTVAISAIYDLATVGRSVDEFNHSHGFSDLRITPTYFASHKAPGVMLTLSF
jgi:hypothetical protein